MKKVTNAWTDSIEKIGENFTKLYSLRGKDMKSIVERDKKSGKYENLMETLYKSTGIDPYSIDLGCYYDLPCGIFSSGSIEGIKLFGEGLTEKEVLDKKVVTGILEKNWCVIETYREETIGKEWLIEEGVLYCTWDKERDVIEFEPNSGRVLVYAGYYKEDFDVDSFIKETLLFGREGIKICKVLSDYVDGFDYEIWDACLNCLRVNRDGDGYRIKWYGDKPIEYGSLFVFNGDGVFVKDSEELKQGLQIKEEE